MLAHKDNQELDNLQAELLKTIAKLESIQFYKRVVRQMQQHQPIRKLIQQKKRIQKELVNAERVNKSGQMNLLSNQLTKVEAQLLAIPLYQQYLSAIEEAQEVLDIISEYIERELAFEDIERLE